MTGGSSGFGAEVAARIGRLYGAYVRRRRELACQTVRLRVSSHSSKQSPCSSTDSRVPILLPHLPTASPMDRPDSQEGSGSSSQCAFPVLSPRPVHRRKLIEPCRSTPPPPQQPSIFPPPPCRTRFMSSPRLFRLRENRTPLAMPAGPSTVIRGTPICGPTRYFDRARKVKCNQLQGQDKVRPSPLPFSSIPLNTMQCTVSGNAIPTLSTPLSRHALTASLAIALSIQELSLHVRPTLALPLCEFSSCIRVKPFHSASNH